jgi:hypothetical protein
MFNSSSVSALFCPLNRGNTYLGLQGQFPICVPYSFHGLDRASCSAACPTGPLASRCFKDSAALEKYWMMLVVIGSCKFRLDWLDLLG